MPTLKSITRRVALGTSLLALNLIVAPGLGAQTAGATAGQNVVGTVTNATTNKPWANQKITLVQLQGSMTALGTTTTDSQGRYRFSESQPGPYMVEAQNQGVSYYATVTTGQSETDLKVYDVSHDAKLVQVDAEVMVLQPAQGQLAVVNEYRVENDLQPARTLAAADASRGMFRFRVAPGAKVDMVRVVGPSEMPVSRTAVGTAQADVYSVPTALRPGETRIQVSYRVPYSALKATLTEKPVNVPQQFEVFVPSPMKFSGAGLTQLGTQDGYTVYGVASGPVPASVTFQVAGNAPMPTPPASSGGSSSSSASSSSASSASTPVGPVPTPTFMERNRWTMLILLCLAAAGGFGYMLSRPEVAAATAGGGSATVPAGGKAVGKNAAAASTPTPAPDAISQLKDDLFFLEVQHNTGRLGEAEYKRQRAALDERMKQLAKG